MNATLKRHIIKTTHGFSGCGAHLVVVSTEDRFGAPAQTATCMGCDYVETRRHALACDACDGALIDVETTDEDGPTLELHCFSCDTTHYVGLAGAL